MISGKAKLAGVVGWPVAHSLSPALHGYWLKTYGIDGAYVPLAVEPKKLKSALRALADAGFRGFNLTVPHKEAALKIMDEVSQEADSIGAVNTVTVSASGALIGTNTDAHGFITHLKQSLGPLKALKKRVLILGAGGAARAAAHALQKEGFEEILITNRTEAKAKLLAKAMGLECVEWKKKQGALSEVTLLVNTTTLGMEGQPKLALDVSEMAEGAAVYDIVYRPLHTPLLRAAKKHRLRTVDGLGMLLHQAAPGFQAWFGVRPEAGHALRAHLLRLLAC